MRLRFLLVAVLVVLAGCNGVLGGSSDEPVETLTPAPVPTDKPTPTPVPQLAPGLTGQGIENAEALAAAHAVVLRNTSFIARRMTTFRFENGTVAGRSVRITRVSTNHEQILATTNTEWMSPVARNRSPARSAYYYSEDGRSLKASFYANGTTVYHESAPAASGFGVNEWTISTIFERPNTRVTNRTMRNGTRVYRVVSAPSTTVNQTTEWIPGLRSVHFRAIIDSRGFVRKFTNEYEVINKSDALFLGNISSAVATTRYTNVGNTTVERPSWYDEAVAATNATTEETTTTYR